MNDACANVRSFAKGTSEHYRAPPVATKTPRVFIASHVRLVREALTTHLSREKRVEVVGSGEPSQGVAEDLAKAQADIVLLDMSVFSSADAATRFVALSSPARVVAFSVAEIENAVLACAESGIAGFVGRDGTIADLVSAVEDAARGELRCSPRIAGLLLGRVAQLGARVYHDSPVLLLTRREREIGGLIAQGLSNKAIAIELRIGLATVKNHVHNILDKLQVQRRGEAAARLRDHVT